MVDRVRKWRAQKQDIFVKRTAEKGGLIVSGSSGNEYRVDPNKPFCSCPDWRKRQPNGGCKHILHVKIENGTLEPIPSANTNFGNPKNRSQSSYPSNWDSLARQTNKRDNWTCQKCSAQGGPYGNAKLAAHHMIPKSSGGSDDVDNLITVCHSCHEEEHGHSIPEGVGSLSYSAGSGASGTSPAKSSLSNSTSSRPTGDGNRRDESSSSQSVSSESSLESKDDFSSSQPTERSFESEEQSSSAKIRSPKPIPSAPKIIAEENYKAFNSRKGPLFTSLAVFAGVGLVAKLLSAGFVGWMGLLVVPAVYFNYRVENKKKKKKVDELKEVNDRLVPRMEEIEKKRSNHGSMKRKKLSKTYDILQEAEGLISDVDSYLNDDYIKWVHKSKTRVEDQIRLEKVGVGGKVKRGEENQRSQVSTSKGWDEREIRRRYR